MKTETFFVYKRLSGEVRIPEIMISDGLCIQTNDCAIFKNEKTGKKITAWVRTLDQFDIDFYNENNRYGKTIGKANNSIILNKHYRKHLGISDNDVQITLNFKKTRNPVKKFFALLQTNDPVIFVSTNLAIISVGLGLVGFVLGIISLYLTCQ